MRRASLMLLAIGCGACFAGTAAASDPSDFGVIALQQAKESYVAGDSAAARRSVIEATGVLATLAAQMSAPGRGEVWMLMNDLRLLRFPAGSSDPATLHSLAEAGTRASALARRYPDASGTPAMIRN